LLTAVSGDRPGEGGPHAWQAIQLNFIGEVRIDAFARSQRSTPTLGLCVERLRGRQCRVSYTGEHQPVGLYISFRGENEHPAERRDQDEGGADDEGPRFSLGKVHT
jgi:hypothetical protein